MLFTNGLLFASVMGMTEMVLAEPAPSVEDMWKIIQQQQKTIEELKTRLEQTENTVETTQEQVVANTEAVEDVEASDGVATWAENSSFGGYGELHYNNVDGKQDQVDFHRFVLFFDHEFSDDLRFFSELEIEHALSGDGEDKPGEVELEQAFIQYDLNNNHSVNAGLYLVPIGIINETHEPPTFYGVERNAIEKDIIPATWWEAGLGLTGEVAPGWKYDVMLSSGLETPTSGSNAFKIRNGRKKVAEAPGEDGAVTGRIRYTGMPGLEIALGGQYQADITQGAADIDATLLSAHIDFRKNGFGLRALYAGWWLDDGAAVTGPAALGRDRQEGFYIEPSYRFPLTGWRGEAGIFARYQQWNNNAGSDRDDNEQIDVGINYWPHPDVVFKFDYQFQNAVLGDHDGFNLGVGYQF